MIIIVIICFQATREAVLDRSDEAREAREQAFANTSSIYDLLTVMLVRRAQFNLLHEVGCLANKHGQFSLMVITLCKMLMSLLIVTTLHKLLMAVL